ncbi:MAG: non-homologous end-joining DNA ligase [Actinomycetota bacterium]|nr:non-homologous end-joining DNA ligase [Actinomycetota bacterium]
MTTSVKAGNRRVDVSRLDKVFYPEVGFTKGDVIEYYRSVAPVLLPHVKGRAVTLKRYPDGVAGNFFYEKRCPPYAPEWIKTVTMRRKRDNKDIAYCRLDNQAALVWAANLANLELHTSLAKAADVTRPTALVFDLDPGPPADVTTCAEVALLIRALLADLGLDSVVKTSGSKGLQLYAPLNTKVSYDQTGRFAHTVALALEQKHPELIVSRMKKELRGGKVLIDWSQNDDHKTTVAAYSLRARPRPTASTPVTWDEIERAAASGRAADLTFEADEVLKRVEEHGDLFLPSLKLRQRLPELPDEL